MNRLFALKDHKGQLAIDPTYDLSNDVDVSKVIYFDNKMEAKKLRDHLNESHGKLKWTVTRGPDHMGKHGHPSKQRKER